MGAPGRAVLAALLLTAASAAADEVRLRGGKTLEGILVSSDAASLTLAVADAGLVVLDSATVTGTARASAAENARLRARWRSERLAAEARERGEAAFERRQRARGLVQYEGDWITRAELDALLAREGLAPRPAPVTVRVTVIERVEEAPPRLFRALLPPLPVRYDYPRAPEPGRILLRHRAPGVSGPLRTSFEVPY